MYRICMHTREWHSNTLHSASCRAHLIRNSHTWQHISIWYRLTESSSAGGDSHSFYTQSRYNYPPWYIVNKRLYYIYVSRVEHASLSSRYVGDKRIEIPARTARSARNVRSPRPELDSDFFHRFSPRLIPESSLLPRARAPLPFAQQSSRNFSG